MARDRLAVMLDGKGRLMNAIVVYESFWGSTAEVARAIASGIGPGVPILTTDGATADVLAAAGLVVVGAPILGFNLTTDSMRRQISSDAKAPRPADLGHPSMRSWLETLPEGSGLYAAFETGFAWSPGGAAKRIGNALEDAGYRRAAKRERFLVAGGYGPLRDGELDRARVWGATLAGTAQSG